MPLAVLDDDVAAALVANVGVIRPGCAVLEGIHSEGPVVADLGGLPPSEQDMAISRFQRLCDRLDPMLRVMTISPSKEARPGSGSSPMERLNELLKRGIVPALGHDKHCTDIDIAGCLRACAEFEPSELVAAPPSSPSPGTTGKEPVDLRSRSSSASDRFPASKGVPRAHLTHLFNVCSLHHRNVGLANAGLLQSLPKLPAYKGAASPTVEIIGDLTHVHPWAISLALNARSARDVCFITDGIAPPEPGLELAYAGRALQVVGVDVPPYADAPIAEAEPTAASASVSASAAASASTAYGRGGAAPPAVGSLWPVAKVVLKGTDTIAGSCDMLSSVLERLVTIFRLPLPRAVAHVSQVPAAIAGLPHVGTLRVGCRADMLVFGGASAGAVSVTREQLMEAVAAESKRCEADAADTDGSFRVLDCGDHSSALGSVLMGSCVNDDKAAAALCGAFCSSGLPWNRLDVYVSAVRVEPT
jgi:N-acetylglucosamine-6-phosphate deacetylase